MEILRKYANAPKSSAEYILVKNGIKAKFSKDPRALLVKSKEIFLINFKLLTILLTS